MQDFGKVNCSLHAAPRRADVSPQLQEVWLRSNNREGGAPSPYISTTASYYLDVLGLVQSAWRDRDEVEG